MAKKAETDFHKNRINNLVKETGVPAQVVEIISDDISYERAKRILESLKEAKERLKCMAPLKELLESAVESDRVQAISKLLGYDEAEALEDDVPAKQSNKVIADYELGKYDEKPGILDKKPGICRSQIYKGYPAMVQASQKK
jgi:TPP-dependent indolepyruvate ferredoxin oxidoreductase alpha subunit